MQDERDLIERENQESPERKNEQPKTDEHPVPGIKHEPEPDAENIMPAQDRPGTF